MKRVIINLLLAVLAPLGEDLGHDQASTCKIVIFPKTCSSLIASNNHKNWTDYWVHFLTLSEKAMNGSHLMIKIDDHLRARRDLLSVFFKRSWSWLIGSCTLRFILSVTKVALHHRCQPLICVFVDCVVALLHCLITISSETIKCWCFFENG